MVPGGNGGFFAAGFRPENGDSGPEMRDAARPFKISVIRARISEGIMEVRQKGMPGIMVGNGS
jgi:hypothetical protein